MFFCLVHFFWQKEWQKRNKSLQISPNKSNSISEKKKHFDLKKAYLYYLLLLLLFRVSGWVLAWFYVCSVVIALHKLSYVGNVCIFSPKLLNLFVEKSNFKLFSWRKRREQGILVILDTFSDLFTSLNSLLSLPENLRMMSLFQGVLFFPHSRGIYLKARSEFLLPLSPPRLHSSSHWLMLRVVWLVESFWVQYPCCARVHRFIWKK